MKIDDRLFYDDFEKLVDTSVERLEFAYETSQRLYKKPLYIAFSGGKDSVCLYGLAKRLSKKLKKPLNEVATFNYNITNLDPPELVNFIKQEYKETNLIHPKKSIWQIIEKQKMPPTRLVRYCCKELKEVRVENVVLITGVRWAESQRRANTRGSLEYSKKASEKRTVLKTDNDDNRREIENCIKFSQLIINPIIDWNNEDVWMFINHNKIKYCKLYDEGEKRLGCIGCPMASIKQRKQDFIKYPKYKEQFIRTFDKMVKAHETTWTDGEDCFEWWVNEDKDKERPKRQ